MPALRCSSGLFLNRELLAFFPSHQWDVAGWSDNDYSTTNLQVGGVMFLGDGMTLGSLPKMNYNWESDEWTVPMNLVFTKTIVTGSQPIKHSLNFDYYVAQPDAFGPDFMFRYTLTPVVQNPLANLLQR